MTIRKTRQTGIELSPENIEGIGGVDLAREGELSTDSSDSELKVHLDSVTRTVVTEDQVQVLTNKTIDADLNTISDLELDNLKTGVLNVSTSLTGASDLQVASALAVKTYIDDKAAAQNEASEISYDPTASGLTATNIQAAIDEVEGRLQTTETGLSNHLSDTTDAHDASAISNTPSGNLAATDIQAAVNELQADIDTNASNLTSHLNDTVDAHDASAISSVASGNLTATDVQTALNELQSDIDLRALTTGGSIITPARLDVKQDTKANLDTYALTATNGQFVFATDTKEMLQIVDTLLVAVGSGGGGIASVDILSAEIADTAAIGDFTQTGLEILETPIVLHGLKSFRLQHATSIKSFKKVIFVDRKFRGKNNTISLDVVSTATNANLNIIFRDETNSVDLGTSQAIATGSQAITATTANASNQLTVMTNDVLNSLKVGMVITGSAIPVGTTITAISSTAATMSQNATGVSTGIRISDLVTKRTFSVDIPANCLNFSWAISTVVEANTESYIDDVVVQLTSAALMSTSVTVPRAVINDYAARIANNGTATITSQTGNIIQSVSRTAAGLVTVNLSPGTFNIAPSVVGVVLASGASFVLQVLTVSTTTITLETRDNGGANALIDKDFSLVITKQGTDFIDPLTATESKTIPLTSAQLVQTPDSTLRLNTVAGYGSSGTSTRRFSSILANVGPDVQYNSDSINGDSFTILTAGIYSVNYTDTFNSVSAMGITLNASTSTLATSLPVANVLHLVTTAAANHANEASYMGYFNAGDVIRAQTNAAPTGATPSQSYFTISKQGSLRQLNLSSDSKITIPTHQLRFEGATVRGSIDTGIVKFDAQTITQGDAFDVLNTTANGTVVTIKKSGKLSVNACLLGAAGMQITISKNQSVLSSIPTVNSEIMQSGYNNVQTRLAVTATFDVNIGDKIRLSSTTAILGSDPSNIMYFSLTENSFSSAFSNILPQWSQSDSSVRLRVGNGFYTQVRRFANTLDNLGTAITYSDTGSDSKFTINEDGNYQISYTDETSTSSSALITKNQINGTAGNLALATQTIASGFSGNLSTQVYLLKNDIIRFIGATPANFISSSANATVSISKVGKPNLSSVDVTSFVNMKTTDVEAIEALPLTSTFGSTNTGVPVLTITRNTNLGVIRIDSSAVNGTSFVALKDCNMNISVAAYSTVTASNIFITRNATLLVSPSIDGIVQSVTTSAANIGLEATTSILLKAGDIVRIQRNSTNLNNVQYVTLTATADNNATASPTQQVSSDTMSFAFKATAINSDTDAIGTFNTYTYAANTNTATISASAPTQTVASMNVNGVQVFGRAFNTTSTTASPARVDIKIGKGLKSKQVDAYANAAKVNSFNYDLVVNSVNQYGTSSTYNELTGILSLNSAAAYTSGNTAMWVGQRFEDGALVTNGYFVFNASKSPSLVTIPNLQQRVAYLSDVKASGTAGGTSVAGFQTRTLNTLVDPTGIVTSLAANRFVLSRGVYSIQLSAPARQSDTHRVRLINITDSTTSLLGTSELAGSAVVSQSSSRISGEITVNSNKTFEVQHQINTARAIDGLGAAGTSGETELYTQVTITKVRDL